MRETHNKPKPRELKAAVSSLCNLFKCSALVSYLPRGHKGVSHQTSVNFCLTINGDKKWHNDKFFLFLSPASFLTDF